MRVLGARSLTWQNVVAKVQAIPPDRYTWTYDKGKGGVSQCMTSESILLNLQLLMLARLPSTVQESEAAGILPLADDVRFADCIFECVAFGQQPFVLAAQAAQHVDLTHDAVRYL